MYMKKSEVFLIAIVIILLIFIASILYINSIKSSGFIDCPDTIVYNRMPCICENESLCGTCENRNYYIKNGIRVNFSEYDLNWVKENCEVEEKTVY